MKIIWGRWVLEPCFMLKAKEKTVPVVLHSLFFLSPFNPVLQQNQVVYTELNIT